MRGVLIAFLLGGAFAAPAFAQAPAPAEARVAYAERRALLAADSACGLFAPEVRAGVDAGAWQARNALLRQGWSMARIGELDAAAVRAARGRACGDARTTAAATRARAGFEAWSRTPSLTFAGGERGWLARRFPDAEGWQLKQTLEDGAAFGVREADNRRETVLTLPLGDGPSPGSAVLVMRDPARSSLTLFDIPGRRATGLRAGLPSPAAAGEHLARGRRIETSEDGARRLVFAFADDLLAAMARLDPREAAEIRLANGQRFLVEVGDLGPARAFLAATPPVSARGQATRRPARPQG